MCPRAAGQPSADSALDATDRAILRLLQEDATISVQQVAERVGLSPTPVWRRMQQLRERGVIRKQVAILAPDKVDLPITVFVAIKTNQHNAEWTDSFARNVKALPEVVEFYRMSGDTDYLLRVVVADIRGYDVFYKKLVKTAKLFDVSSSFAMEQIKYTTALPI
jgi:Lrp/AsnC family transcriptional regulator